MKKKISIDTITGPAEDMLEGEEIEDVFTKVIQVFPFPDDLDVLVTYNKRTLHHQTKESFDHRYSINIAFPRKRKLVEAFAMEYCWEILRYHYWQHQPLNGEEHDFSKDYMVSEYC